MGLKAMGKDGGVGTHFPCEFRWAFALLFRWASPNKFTHLHSSVNSMQGGRLH